ncbi:gamma-glutamylcyclotransferase family protein [Pelagibacterium montanilacus]|uniref:gamma-glutamylcyclotransferase family protein n=1 Tax=Pelagibacterium montanilacus TaxID=2185280 RepID=UPI0013E0818C|nr:gamma-glutamylcyclotransferase family protein [Pelagibacterium montanilacus]
MSPAEPLPLLVYGTLREDGVRGAVIGRDVGVNPCVFTGFRVVYYPGATYPGLVVAPGAVAEGLLVMGLDAFDLVVLDLYEGPGYRREIIGLEPEYGGSAQVYMPTPPIGPEAADWTFAHWSAHHRSEKFRAEARWARETARARWQGQITP